MPVLTSAITGIGPFSSGGCIVGDGELISVRGDGLGDLVSIRLRDGRTETLDTQIEMPDCVPATLFGRTGVVMIHRGMQVRFYYRTAPGTWASRDIYSIYTPSYQSGLAMADVNGDGRVDIFCGNYWIESPERWEESWRLFAINTWFEHPQSARLRIVVLTPRSIVAAQSHGRRAARFDALDDPKLQWKQTPVMPQLINVSALSRWNRRTLAGERNGSASKLIAIDTAEVIGQGVEVLSIVPLRSGEIITVEPNGVRYRSQRPRK